MDCEVKQKGLFRAAQAAPPCLIPIDRRAHEIMAELAPDKKALIQVHTPRYPEHHGLVFMVLGRIAEMTNRPLRSVVLSLLFDTGHFDYVTLMDGSVIPDPESLSPESMTQAEFQKFWDAAEDLIKTTWRPLFTPAQFQEIETLMKGNQP